MTGRPVPYTGAEMARLMSPRSVAIVGASERTGSFGNRAMENLASFDGPVYLVNARYREIGGKACYPDVTALPEVPDCVYIAVGREAVEPIVTHCAER
jgi:acyl-CoA synthetase (NDP forming)